MSRYPLAAGLSGSLRRTVSPSVPEIGVVGLVPNAWTDLWQPRHHVMWRLSRYFNVTWVNPVPDWRRALRVKPATHRNTSATAQQVETGFQVYDAPPYLPRVYRPGWLRRRLEFARLRQAWNRLAAHGAERSVLYLWRPMFAESLGWPHDFSAYHIDDDYSFDLRGTSIDPNEMALIRRVNQVIIHSPQLMEEKGGLNPATVNVPNGVDYRAYAAPRPEPLDLAAIPHPRIGYAGWLKMQLDWALLDAIAAARPAYSLVLVGATKHTHQLQVNADYRALRARPNVHFLGRKTPDELARYPQHFDVCVMPYVMTPYTDRIYPLKLHEYLATGRPVVGTPIRTLSGFSDVVGLAQGRDAWLAALEVALSPRSISPEAQRVRQRIAREHDWDTLVLRIARALAAGLGEETAKRLEQGLAGASPTDTTFGSAEIPPATPGSESRT